MTLHLALGVFLDNPVRTELSWTRQFRCHRRHCRRCRRCHHFVTVIIVITVITVVVVVAVISMVAVVAQRRIARAQYIRGRGYCRFGRFTLVYGPGKFSWVPSGPVRTWPRQKRRIWELDV